MNSEVVAGLMNAKWPVILLDESGAIVAANLLAVQTFGQKLNTPPVPLASLWPDDNGQTAAQFLRQIEIQPALPFPLKLLGVGKSHLAFAAVVSPVFAADDKQFLLQLFPEKMAAAPKPAAPTVDAGLAHKQKLDCALQFARTVSLDFNNALTIILGHTSHLLTRSALDNPWRESLIEIEKSAAKAAEIANDLGAFSLHDKPAPHSSGDLNLLIENMLEGFRRAELKADIEWSVALDPKLHTARFDEAKLRSALIKILENAVESISTSGGIIIQTRDVSVTEPLEDQSARIAPGNYVCVEISDSGCGIPAETLPRIFEPFFTTKSATGNRGLGLAWVYGIVTNQGGAVAVSSELNVGTSVRVYLPADKKIVQSSTRNAAELRGTETILMVDDEELLLTMGRTILSANGYKVLTCNNGDAALEVLAKNDPPIDLLLTDLVMPNMGGRELAEKAHKINPSLRILSSSGYVRPASEDDSQTSFLQKPFNTVDLLRKVRSVLSNTG